MAKYKKRADGRYCTHVHVGSYNTDGSPKRKTLYAKTIRELDVKVAEIRQKMNTGTYIQDNNLTLGTWAKEWLDTYKIGVEYNTTRMYKMIIDNYIIEPLGHMKLQNIKTVHLQKIINENQEKSWIIKKFKLTINQIFEQAVINDLIIKNPVRGIKLPVITKNTKKRTLTESETEKILTLQLDGKTRCFIFLLLYTGMRKSEILALSKSDIDKENNKINVSKTLIFKVNQSTIKHSPKTFAGIRTIPILTPLRDVLFSYMDSIESEILFTGTSGNTLSHTAYRRMWEKFTKAMGETDLTAHNFRHNFATTLYDAGVDVKTAQSILGHTSIQVTLDIYTKLSESKMAGSIDMLDSFVAGKQKPLYNTGT
jgi:integrase